MRKWKTVLVLIFMGLALYNNWNWFWAILLILGLFHHIVSKEIHFVETITKKETPVLYYILLLFWSGLTYYSVQTYLTF